MHSGLAAGQTGWFSRVGLVLIAIVAVSGCGRPVQQPPPTSPAATVDPLTAAIARREAAGFRADEAFVRLLLGDVTAVARGKDFGMPLTVAELDALRGRNQNADEIAAIIRDYGEEHPDEWAGLYVDHQANGLIAVQFTGHIEEHELALAQLLSPTARWQVREARWALRDLQGLAERIKGEAFAIRSLGGIYAGGGVDESENIVEVRVETDDPATADRIIEHFDPAGRLRVIIVPPPPRWTGPRGRVIVIVKYADGSPGEDLQCRIVADDPSAWSEVETRASQDDGRCDFQNVGATGIDVQVGQYHDGVWGSVASARSHVVPDDEVVVRVVIP